MTPLRLDEIVRICLLKDTDDRWQAVRDVGRQVQGIIEGGSSASVGTPTSIVVAPRLRVWQRPVPLVLAAVAFVAMVLAAWMRPAANPPEVMRFTLHTPELSYVGSRESLAISPDGTRVVIEPMSLVGSSSAPLTNRQGFPWMQRSATTAPSFRRTVDGLLSSMGR